jgi:uncharacterized membrane protein
MKKETIILYSVIILVLIAAFAFSNYAGELLSENTIETQEVYSKGLVIDVEDKRFEGDYSYDYQEVFLKITSGPFKNKYVNVENHFSEIDIYNIVVEPGQKVILMIQESGDNLDVFIADYARDQVIYILIGLFLLVLLIVGKLKGLKTILTISLTVILIFKVLLPAILIGYNPLFVTITIAALITLITITTIAGFHIKTFAAIFGTIFGVVIAGLISIIAAKAVHLTGLSSEESIMLMYIPQEISLNFQNLLFSGILLGALGAVMDVAMSIASSIHEVHSANPSLNSYDLLKSGMSVGRDIMGTMSNTLILAYAGSFIPLMLLFMSYETPMTKLINLDIVATEITRSLAGSIGLILTIPITAIVSVFMISRTQTESEKTD